jgi:multidrug efflux pump subunit AcrB
MWLIKASLKNPYMVATIVFMILVIGIKVLLNIPFDILPAFKTPAVQVLTYFQGMPATSIEKTITSRIERWVNQAPGADVVTSKSVPGVSVVRILFRDDIDSNKALTMTNSLALGTLATLPPNTLPPVVLPYDPTGTLPLGILVVSNDQLNEARVKDVARVEVRNALGSVPGCVAPVVVGGKDRTILIYLNPKKMDARKVSPLDVVNALRQGNLMVTPGTAYFGNNQVLLDTNVMVNHVKELNDLPIRSRPGEAVYLRDIGRAEDSNAIQTSRVRRDGHSAVYVPIYRQQGASSLAVARGVANCRADLERRLQSQYPGTKLELVMDQSFYVQKTIWSLVKEGLMGAGLVSVMILLFLGNWRMTVIATLSIPLAVLGAVIGLYTTGNTINVMTLAGLALAIGPLVDDAIVELENNHRNYHLGKSRVRAALDGCAEVMIPVLVATFTTTIVLAPVALMPGMGGFLFKPLALAVAFAMVTSFLLSRTFVPMMCAKFLPDEHRHTGPGAASGNGHGPAAGHPPRGWFGQLHHRIEGALAALTAGYERLLRAALRHRGRVLLAVGVLFVVSLSLVFFIGREFFPQMDAGQLTMYVRCPSNLRLDAAEKRITKVESFVKHHIAPEDLDPREGGLVISEIGLDPDWSAAYTANSGQQDAVIRIQLATEHSKSSQEYAAILRHAFAEEPDFADLRVSFDTGGMVSTALNMGTSSPIDVEISGSPPIDKKENMTEEEEERQRARAQELVERLAHQLAHVAAGVRGAVDVRVQQRNDAPYQVIEVDRQKAAAAGLSTESVILQVVAAMNSSVSINRNFWVDLKTGNQYFVAAQYPESRNTRLQDVLNVFATGTNQPNTVRLSSLAKIRRSSGAVEINHTALYRTYNVLINTEGRDVAGVAANIEKRLKELAPGTPGKDEWLLDGKYQGVRWSLKGEYKRMNESTANLAYGLAGAAVLVYLLQVALFRSWIGPFIIMFTVPLGLIGVLTTLFLTGTTLNVQSQMGVIFLVGIAVNNGVLLVEFANKQRRLGAPVHKAIATAATIRFRPILMTFLATFLALLPQAVSAEHGSEATKPLARAVVGGLLTSTALTLFVVPILYTLFLRDPLPPEVDLEAELADRAETATAESATAPLPSGAGAHSDGEVVVARPAPASIRAGP